VADGARAIVRGERVWLRPFEPADLDAYHRFINDVEPNDGSVVAADREHP
jgi:hypothetical protein